jgi:UDP-N-acetylmuramoyl-L-alanyl-D-glutamate--2,6-diaminopimelate ligase
MRWKMKLFYLLKNINARVFGNCDVDITGLYHKDTEVKEGGLFFCLRGTKVDGTSYVSSAIKNGAVAIVAEQEIQNLSGITQIIVKNARETMSLIASKFYGNPAGKLKIIGVTGTNGKTTITNMLASILEKFGKKCAIIGTNGVFFAENKFDTAMTTPDPIELQKYFAMMVKSKVEYVCMEVSAHAIDLHKVDGFVFEEIIFTNLTEDHLDYFKTMERYFSAKASIFSKQHTKFAILNFDDDYAVRLSKCINVPFLTYAINEKADYMASEIKTIGTGQTFKLNSSESINLSMAGKFNVSNALASISATLHLGFDLKGIADGLSSMKQVAGRFNTIMVNGVLIVVDYAHTPDGLSNILLTCKDIAKRSKLISVFGCGGNRESQKRSIMGEISSKIADYTIITSDNPRFEAREKIAADIEKGMINSNYVIELDRSKAIEKAIFMAKKGDVVVVAGKGAEPYIDENGVKIPYSDFEEIEKIRSKFHE